MSEWRPVVGYEAFYEVSDQGEVRSLPRRVGARFGSTRVQKPRIKTQRCWKNDYWRVSLSDGAGVTETRKVHHLVAAAFLGPRPEGLLVLHKDDDKSRNCLPNLYYGTPAQNARDKVANGKHRPGGVRGEGHWRSRLKASDALEIVSLRASGATCQSIANSFGVAEMTIQDVTKGKTWGWLTGIRRAA